MVALVVGRWGGGARADVGHPSCEPLEGLYQTRLVRRWAPKRIYLLLIWIEGLGAERGRSRSLIGSIQAQAQARPELERALG